MNTNPNFLIVGVGLIGGSIAKGLSKHGYHVFGYDINQDAINYAYEHKIIENDVCNDDVIKNADVIIIGLYPSIIKSWIKDHQHLFKDTVLITDVTGVKGSIVNEIQSSLVKGEFLAMHPMAGKEVTGVQHSDDKIFKGANLLIVPTEKNTYGSIEFLKEFGEVFSFKYIEVISIDEHDKMISFLSQLPHAIAVALMCDRNNDHLIRYTGDSFRDLTRIAKINADLWSELFISNKDNLCSDIDSFIKTLETVKEAVQKEDTESLKEMFRTSKTRRTNFDK